jgi:hypothetical protein
MTPDEEKCGYESYAFVVSNLVAADVALFARDEPVRPRPLLLIVFRRQLAQVDVRESVCSMIDHETLACLIDQSGSHLY